MRTAPPRMLDIAPQALDGDRRPQSGNPPVRADLLCRLWSHFHVLSNGLLPLWSARWGCLLHVDFRSSVVAMLGLPNGLFVVFMNLDDDLRGVFDGITCLLADLVPVLLQPLENRKCSNSLDNCSNS